MTWSMYVVDQSGPKLIKNSLLTQLSMKFILLVKVKIIPKHFYVCSGFRFLNSPVKSYVGVITYLFPNLNNIHTF